MPTPKTGSDPRYRVLQGRISISGDPNAKHGSAAAGRRIVGAGETFRASRWMMPSWLDAAVAAGLIAPEDDAAQAENGPDA